jgi:hypothetical protein
MNTIYGQTSAELKVFAEKILQSKEDVVLYGGGQTGRRVFSMLKLLGFNITAVLDKNPELEKNCNGTPFIHPDQFTDLSAVIILCTINDFDSVANYLRERGFKNILPCFFYTLDASSRFGESIGVGLFEHYLDNAHDWLLSLPPEKILYSIDLPITMRCSLRCKDCSNLMQYFSNPRNADYDTMRRSLARLLSVLDFCCEIRILGGEPFVNKELHFYITMLSQYSNKYDWITVFTNGTILPDEQTLSALNNERVLVKISDYGIATQKISALTSLFEKQGISYSVSDVTDWQDCGTLRNYSRNRTENESVLKNCCVGNVPSIVDGKFFRCPYSGNLWSLQGIPFGCHEFVDLLDDKFSDNEIQQSIARLVNTNFLKACDFCGGRPLDGSNAIPAARQTDKPLPYKQYQI